MITGHGAVTLLLIAMAAGYGTLVLASKQEKPLDKLGRLVGGIVLAVSFVGLLCSAVCAIKYRCGACPYGRGVNCGYDGHEVTPPSAK